MTLRSLVSPTSFSPAVARFLAAGTLCCALGACGGGPAAAQAVAPAPEDLALAHLYEVAPEQAAHGAPAPVQEAPPFIEVSGSATVTVTPDHVQASFAVETQAGTAAEAAARNAEAMDRVIRALRASGIRGIEVESFGYALRPDYAAGDPRSGRARVIDGYTAVNNVRAASDDVQAAGRLVDVAVGNGANRVSSLAFEASDTDAARREALRLAVRSARLQAEAMADALGWTLGVPLEVRGGAQLPYPRGGGEVMFRAAEVSTPIEAGDVNVSANVTVRFALGVSKGGD